GALRLVVDRAEDVRRHSYVGRGQLIVDLGQAPPFVHEPPQVLVISVRPADRLLENRRVRRPARHTVLVDHALQRSRHDQLPVQVVVPHALPVLPHLPPPRIAALPPTYAALRSW